LGHAAHHHGQVRGLARCPLRSSGRSRVGAPVGPAFESELPAGAHPIDDPAAQPRRTSGVGLASRDRGTGSIRERCGSVQSHHPLGRCRPSAGRSTVLPGPRAVARLNSATATSAGGIVIRYVDAIPQLVVGRRKRERDGQTWTLPKGTPIPGETLEETALREVQEETGLTVRILSPLDAIKYTFVQRGTRIHKTVHYFMMEPTGGAMESHDHEFEEVKWVSFDTAAQILSFETERSLVGLAATRLPQTAG